MSGGYFYYNQYHIGEIALAIEEIISINDTPGKDELGYEIGYDFTKQTIDEFEKAVVVLRKAAMMVEMIDYLVSDDDSEETFHRRWEEELGDE